MTIVFASDHAGFELKGILIAFVKERGLTVEDLGPPAYDETDDYPDFISQAARAVSQDPAHTKGIVLGGSGQGEAMVANRFKGVRAAVFYGGTPDIVKRSRIDNDCNILSIAARFASDDEAREAVAAFLDTSFPEEERHVRRIKKIDSYAS